MVSTAVMVRLMQSLMPLLKEGVQALRTPTPHEDLRPDMDEFVTIATYDQTIDAHIAMGRLSAEGIEARLFDDNMVQMDWLYSIAVGGIKLRVARIDAKAAREVLETDYSAVLDESDQDDLEK
ncbi:MAG TPA: hypothetical protein VGT99_03715 [Gammaproteobacteria bacterium]|nr:hypothetical protein [Gammaproteobacteria bacterium]